ASPKVYGEGTAEKGKAAFDALLNGAFPLNQPASAGRVGAERSPYGIALGITYPKADIDALFAAIGNAREGWRKAGPEAWVGVCGSSRAAWRWSLGARRFRHGTAIRACSPAWQRGTRLWSSRTRARSCRSRSP